MTLEERLAKLDELLDDANERNDHVLAAILHAAKKYAQTNPPPNPPPGDGG